MGHRQTGAGAMCLALLIALATPGTAAPDVQHSALPNGWRLIRTKNPNGGPDAVSVSHTADVGRSDIDLAGIMLRCGEKDMEVIVVAVTPFSPRVQPEVTLRVNAQEWHFQAHVISPGAELQLPAEALRLALGPWQTARELAIKVVAPGQSFSGVVPIEGMAEALAALAASCPPG